MLVLLTTKLIARMCKASICSCDGFRTSQAIQKCKSSIASLLQKLSRKVKGSSLEGVSMDNMDYSCCSFHLYFTLNSYRWTPASHCGLRDKLCKHEGRIIKHICSRPLHLFRASTPLIATSVHGLKIISDCLTYPGPQCEIIMMEKIVKKKKNPSAFLQSPGGQGFWTNRSNCKTSS